MPRDARFVGPVERLLYLRSLPGFVSLGASELATIAYETRERFFKRGQRLFTEGEAARAVHFLVEGRVSVRSQGRILQLIEPPYTVGFLPVLARGNQHVEARVESDTLTLELPAESVHDAFEDSFALLETGVRQLARQFAEVQRKLELRGLVERAPPVDTPYPEAELDLVERLVALRRTGPYVAASLDSLTGLVRRMQEVRFEPGDVLWEEKDPSTYGIHVVHGTVMCVGDDGLRRFPMGPGSVIGYSEILAEDLATRAPDALPDLTRIGDAGKHLLELISDVLDLAKLESGKLELHRARFEIGPLVEEAVDSVKGELARNDNDLQVSCPPSIGELCSDRQSVLRVLRAVLGNAAKFTHRGVIELDVRWHARHDGKHLACEIRDSGIGIPMEKRDRLFDAFQQADSSTTRWTSSRSCSASNSSFSLRAGDTQNRARAGLSDLLK